MAAGQRPIQMPDAIPPHLKEAMEADDDAKERVEEEAKKEAPDDEKKELTEVQRAMMQKEYNFEFSYKDAHGKVWTGTFTNTVTSIKMQRLIGRYRAELNLGTPFTMLDPVTSELNMILAHLGFSLKVDANPEGHWAHDLEALEDFNVLYKLYEEVMAHEATFLGRAKTAEAG